jgi:hypothetical protein
MTGHIRNPVTEPKESIELSKLVAERDKLVLEVEQLRAAALTRDELQTKYKNETKRAALDLKELRRKAASARETGELELTKLRNDSRDAKWSQYFEFGKVLVPAISIFVTGMLAVNSLGYQREKDRVVDISKQLEGFQNQIVANDSLKQRNAIAAIRSLRGNAVPSLLANLDLDHDAEILNALHFAVLQLNEDATLRELILRELLASIKDVTLRHDIPHLRDVYLKLWEACLSQYKSDAKILSQAHSSGDRLADELSHHIQVTIADSDSKNKATLLELVNKLRPKPGG